MTYKSSFAFNLIYVIRVNDESHQGCLKIGKTTVDCETSAAAWPPPNSKLLNQAAKDRINRYMQTGGFAYDLLHTELAVRAKTEKPRHLWTPTCISSWNVPA